MANHKSALKRIRSNEAKRLRNRYQLKSARTLLKKVVATTDKEEATTLLKTAFSTIDKLAKKNIIHKNKASRQKAQIAKKVAAL